MAGPWEKYSRPTADQIQAEASSGPWSKYQQPAEPKTGAGQAFIDHAADAATLGYAPNIVARGDTLARKARETLAFAGLGPDTPEMVDKNLRDQGFRIEQPEESYVNTRDDIRKRMAQESAEHPYASFGGTIAGIGLTAPLALSKAAAAPTALGRVGAATKTGAALGAVANPGDEEGVIDPLMLGARARNSLIGGAFGGGVAGLAEVAGPVASYVSRKLGKKAEQKTIKALGGTKKENELLIDRGQDETLARELLDEGAIPFFGSPKRILDRVEAAKERAGKNIGQIIDQADEVRADYTPIKIRDADAGNAPYSQVKFVNHPKGKVVQEEILETPIRIDENPMKRAMPWLRDEDAPARVIRGEAQPSVRELRTKPGIEVVQPNQTRLGKARPFKKEVVAGKTRSQPAENAVIDGSRLAKSLKRDPEIANLRNIPGAEGIVGRVEKMLETLRGNGRMSIKQAQKLRQGIDELINFSKRSDELGGVQSVLYKMRDKLRGAMNDVAENVKAGDLRGQNLKFSRLSQAEDMLSGKVAREAANRAVGLTDTISGGSGAAVGALLGGPAGAAVGAAVGAIGNKVARTYGSAMAARTYDAASKVLRKTPAVTAFLNQNPLMAQVIINRIGGGKDFQESEFRDVLKNPEVMTTFRDNPALIDAIVDDKLRTAIRNGVKRGPASK